MNKSILAALLALATIVPISQPAMAGYYGKMRESERNVWKAQRDQYRAAREASKGDFDDARDYARDARRHMREARHDRREAARKTFWY